MAASKNLTVLWTILVLSQVIIGVSSNVVMTISCPYTWTPWGTHCYYFSATYSTRSWDQAQAACEQQGTIDGVTGSNLASIHSAEEEHMVKTWYGLTADNLHIGLQQTAVGTNEYKWVDGTALDFTNWGDNEPTYNTSADLQCAYIERKVDKWHDLPCTGNLHSNFVCKGNTGTFATTTTTAAATETPPAPPSLSGGQVFGIIIGVALGVGLVIVGVIMWRRYDVTSTIRSTWESYSGGGRSNMDSRSVDNVSVASVNVTQNQQPDVTANRGSHFSNANYDIPK